MLKLLLCVLMRDFLFTRALELETKRSQQQVRELQMRVNQIKRHCFLQMKQKDKLFSSTQSSSFDVKRHNIYNVITFFAPLHG